VYFLLRYQNICMIGNMVHNFDLRVSLRYMEQFHNESELFICVPDKVDSVCRRTWYILRRTAMLYHANVFTMLASQLVGFHILRIGHCHHIFLL